MSVCLIVHLSATLTLHLHSPESATRLDSFLPLARSVHLPVYKLHVHIFMCGEELDEMCITELQKAHFWFG